MLLHVIFLQYISIASAGYEFFSSFFDDSAEDEDDEVLYRYTRQKLNKNNKDLFKMHDLDCDNLRETSTTPFIALMLLKSSGHFLGMGSIIDKKTVLTARVAVEQTLKKPRYLIIVAGRLSPWWGRDSQVTRASEIIVNDFSLALIILKNELKYNHNIRPISLPHGPVPPNFEEEYDQHWAVFGIPRSSWDIPGDRAPKSTIYVMKIETVTQKKIHSDECKASYPDLEYNDTTMICTYSNGSFCWGCIGSPIVTVNKKDKVLQIAVLAKAAYSDADNYHVHVKIGFFHHWIRSHTTVGYRRDEEHT